MSEREPPSSLDDLETRLKKARADAFQSNGGEQGSSRASGLSVGFQVATELVVAMVVAVAIGWFLDEWLETRPLFLVIFVFLGAAAGVLNVYCRARRIIARGDMGSGDLGGEDKEEDRETELSAKPPEKQG